MQNALKNPALTFTFNHDMDLGEESFRTAESIVAEATDYTRQTWLITNVAGHLVCTLDRSELEALEQDGTLIRE